MRYTFRAPIHSTAAQSEGMHSVRPSMRDKLVDQNPLLQTMLSERSWEIRTGAAMWSTSCLRGRRELATYLPSCHLETSINHGLKILHKPVSARRGCSLDWFKVPPVSPNAIRDLQDAPAWPSKADQPLREVRHGIRCHSNLCMWSFLGPFDVSQARQLPLMEAVASLCMFSRMGWMCQLEGAGIPPETSHARL